MNAVATLLKRDALVMFLVVTFAVTLGLFALLNSPAVAAPAQVTGAAIDVHTHIASQALTDRFTGGGVPAADADDLVARLDEGNVQRAVILSAAYLGTSAGFTDDFNVIPENDYVAAEVAKYPDRLIGFCGINPLFDSALAEIDRCLSFPGMIGVKLHLEASGVDMANIRHVRKLAAVFDRIAELDIPVLMHVADPGGMPLVGRAFSNLAALLNEHPTVRVVHAHCAGNTDDDTIETWLRLGNSGYNPETSYVEISACLTFHADAPLAQRELMVWRFRKWGIAHVLFGSDYFKFDGETPLQTLDILSKYPFTEEELNIILTNDGSEWLGQ